MFRKIIVSGFKKIAFEKNCSPTGKMPPENYRFLFVTHSHTFGVRQELSLFHFSNKRKYFFPSKVYCPDSARLILLSDISKSAIYMQATFPTVYLKEASPKWFQKDYLYLIQVAFRPLIRHPRAVSLRSRF